MVHVRLKLSILTETQEKGINGHFVNAEKCCGNDVSGYSDNLEEM